MRQCLYSSEYRVLGCSCFRHCPWSLTAGYRGILCLVHTGMVDDNMIILACCCHHLSPALPAKCWVVKCHKIRKTNCKLIKLPPIMTDAITINYSKVGFRIYYCNVFKLCKICPFNCKFGHNKAYHIYAGR